MKARQDGQGAGANGAAVVVRDWDGHQHRLAARASQTAVAWPQARQCCQAIHQSSGTLWADLVILGHSAQFRKGVRQFPNEAQQSLRNLHHTRWSSVALSVAFSVLVQGGYVEATACRPGRAATARATDISRQFSEPNFGVPPLTPDQFHAAPIPARHTLHALHAQHPLALYRRRRGSMRGAPARRPARPSAAARAPPLRALPCSPKPRTPYDPAVLVHRLSSRLTGC